MGSIISASPEETERFGRRLGEGASPRSVFALYGELGAGKSTLARGLAHGIGAREPVTSPTFTLVQEYRSGRLPLVHVDLYRLEGPQEAEALHLEEFWNEPAVVVIEWPEKMEELLPPQTERWELLLLSENERMIRRKAG
ncbi:tRNA (adenosine(37)-N6)-threonylcarbamoyltransferase complex ATPase subunit type 1 TsaE [Methylacidimicrobium sp. B4]|uniref:tRNA (adenosine(37)-N6)-threonylcarbamoyltransferase complex ATPase subunit type 1 TsaE n=1 Tax=Methylacidimicrobium sp. B4 TaxID=2796139 RepID=UPI001A8C7053|nr:tRNA (adenosine(37)-N6)-threonylcarbamoyltransferase complex ATPase subunit type 1 TsaE [Methylacidimicrobium sp. B4]QSR84130.1 tRNA (adenosine(37)-N6)-threonylcarbamoyltransferase complex ATPase subunit type 1 TsaE [Methylacidimicrobium sp. B4]